MITLPAPDPRRTREQATAELKRQLDDRRRKSDETVFVPDAAGGDPIPWE
jgi:hypothetical protein